MPYKIVGFAECLNRIMKTRGLSAADLAALLNLKSKTTVVRILQNNAGEKAILNFRNLLANSSELALTAEELQKLDDSVSCQRKETDQNLLFGELWALLYRRKVPHGEVRLLGHERYATLTEFGNALYAEDVDCLVINCGFHSFVDAAAQFMEKHTAHSLSMAQYFCSAGDYPRRMVQMIGRIVPILAQDNYMAYTVTQELPDGCFDLHAVAVRCGSGKEYELLFCNDRTALLTEGEGLYRKWQSFLSGFTVMPVKSVKSPDAYNFIGFMEHYRKIEEGHDIYKFRPDLCINCIPVPIMKAAFLEGYEAIGWTAPKDMFAALVAIQKKRYANVHSREQTTHLVISAKAMRTFAETGRMADHLYTMRPFTVDERLQILRTCLKDMGADSPKNFHIHLLCEEDEERIYANEYPIEMVCYDGSCVQLTPALTDYDFQKGHSELFIEQEIFRKLFVDFFMNDLVQYHTLPEDCTAELFRELIAELEAEVSGETF